MLHLLDESLEAMLRAVVPLDPREVDVAFAAPDKAWGARVTRPTVNLFLFDIHRSGQRSVSGVERTMRDGGAIRRMALPRIEFSYLVTAWTMDPRDEHQLLGSVLRAVLAHGDVPIEHLKGELADGKPLPELALAAHDSRTSAELWSALEGQLKACLEITVTAVIDPDLFAPLGPPPEEIEIVVADREDARRRSQRSVRPATAETTDPG